MNTTCTTTTGTWRTRSRRHRPNLAYVITRERVTLAPRLHTGANTPQRTT